MTLHVAYFGLPLAAYLLLQDGYRLEPCVLSPLPAPGRRRLMRRFGIEPLDARELGVELTRRVDDALHRDPPDLLVSWFWTRKLPERWLRSARLDAIGAHPSLLPRHRGPNPFFWAIDSGDAETGVSVHRLEAEYDTGAVLDREVVRVGERDAWQLARALDRASLGALRRTLFRYAHGERPAGEPQDEADATLAPEPDGALLHADFHWPTSRVLRRIRALSPVPGLGLELFGVEFFVTRAHPAPDFTAALLPGEAELRSGRLLLRTGDGAICVERAVVARSDDLTDEVDGATLAAELGRMAESEPVKL